jgi:F-type H+-transporting ATPase subunit b
MGKAGRWTVVAATVMAAWTRVVSAAEDTHEGSSNLFSGDVAMSIATLVIFGLVILVLGRFAWRPMLNALQAREKFIRESLDSARSDREKAEASLREYEEKLRQAREEASRMVEEGRRDAEAVRRRIEEEARTSAEQITERAKREIGVARDSALRDLHEQAADLAMTMARQVLKRQLSPEDHQQLVRDALGELEQRSSSPN